MACCFQEDLGMKIKVVPKLYANRMLVATPVY